MIWEKINFKSEQIIGRAKELWGILNSDKQLIISGRADQMIGRLCESYGKVKYKEALNREHENKASNHTLINTKNLK